MPRHRTHPSAPRRSVPRRPTAGLAGLVCAVVLLTGCMSAGQTKAWKAMNADRDAHRLGSLAVSKTAQRKAQSWVEHMARTGSVEHSSLLAGYEGRRVCSVGENVGMGPSITAVETAFMKSPSHAANILSTKWNYVGIGYKRVGRATYVVQEFVKYC